MVDRERLDAGTPGAIQAGRVRAIGNDDRDCGVEASVTGGIDERLEVAASPRDQDAQAAVVDGG